MEYQMESEEVKEHLLDLEKRLMTYGYHELDTLLADDFLEYGSSGAIYTKQDQLDAVKNCATPATQIEFTVSDFMIRHLAPNLVQATYRTYRHHDQKQALRSSIWRLQNGNWTLIFHQGTLTT